MASFQRLKLLVFAFLFLAVLAWRFTASIGVLWEEAASFDGRAFKHAMTAPLLRRIQASLASTNPTTVKPESQPVIRGTSFGAYSLLHDHVEPGARVYFVAARTLDAFRLLTKLSSLLYPRVFSFVEPTDDWQPPPCDPSRTTYVLDFDLHMDRSKAVRAGSLVLIAEKKRSRLWRWDGPP